MSPFKIWHFLEFLFDQLLNWLLDDQKWQFFNNTLFYRIINAHVVFFLPTSFSPMFQSQLDFSLTPGSVDQGISASQAESKPVKVLHSNQLGKSTPGTKVWWGAYFICTFWPEQTEVKTLNPNIRKDVIIYTEAIELCTAIGNVFVINSKSVKSCGSTCL